MTLKMCGLPRSLLARATGRCPHLSASLIAGFMVGANCLPVALSLSTAAATITVTNTTDHDLGSLRLAINAAAPGETIEFASGITGEIALNGGLIISKNLTLDGPGSERLAIRLTNERDTVLTIISGTVTVSGLTITGGNGTGFSGGGSNPGGIFNAASLTLSDMVITGNSGLGGGIVNASTGTLLLMNSAVVNNRSHVVSGGGVQNSGTMTIMNTTVSRSAAVNGASGGGIANTGTLTLINSAVSGNCAQGAGGGIANGGTLRALNTTISDNTGLEGNCAPGASAGGGIANNSSLFLVNCTIFGNTAPSGAGGGIYNEAPGTVMVKSTIVAGNFPGDNCAGIIIPAAPNLDDDFSCGFGPAGTMVVGLDPTLADNGGPTQTHALLPGSPAIDAVSPRDCTDDMGDALTNDQLGVSRPQGAACDIGALEFACGNGAFDNQIDNQTGGHCRSGPHNGQPCILSSECDSTPFRGDGVCSIGGERCDDGNLLNGDGCSLSCAVETGFFCSGEPSTCAAFTPTPTLTPTPTSTATPSQTATQTTTDTPTRPATPTNTPTLTPMTTPTPPNTPTNTRTSCAGDCDHSGTVAVNELVRGVNIALNLATLDQCPEFDCNGNERVTVDCLVKAVNAALSGCAG